MDGASQRRAVFARYELEEPVITIVVGTRPVWPPVRVFTETWTSSLAGARFAPSDPFHRPGRVSCFEDVEPAHRRRAGRPRIIESSGPWPPTSPFEVADPLVPPAGGPTASRR